MVELVDKETQKHIGEVSDNDFQFLIDHLEEESETDDDYYIDRETLDYLKESGMPPTLSTLLETALGSRADMEIVFHKK